MIDTRGGDNFQITPSYCEENEKDAGYGEHLEPVPKSGATVENVQ